MAYFFFHHPLKSRGGIPGRYGFRAHGRIVDADGAESVSDVVVPADGTSDDTPGPNIDPCIFASPLPVVHTFCRLDRRGGKYYVDGDHRLLSAVVRSGDTIFYGHLRTRQGSPSGLFVDTAVVVARTVDLPTTRAPGGPPGKPFRIVINDDVAHRLLSDPAAVLGGLRNTALYQNNLVDASQGRGHEFTGAQPHRVIVGAAADPGRGHEALQRGTTSFVPIVEQGSRALPPMVHPTDDGALWAALTEWIRAHPRMAHGYKPPTELPVDLGERIYRVTRRISGRGGPFAGKVAIPPLHWPR